MRYRPSPSVTTARVFSMSAGLAASTVTPGSTAPDVSRTTPVMLLCAEAEADRTRNDDTTTRHGIHRDFIIPLPSVLINQSALHPHYHARNGGGGRSGRPSR